MAEILDAGRVISGNFGQVFHEGEWLTNITRCEANVEIGFEEVRRSGTRWLGHKPTTLNGSGTISGYLVTSEFLELISQITDDRSPAFSTELIVKLDDPNSFGAYRVRLKGVTFNAIPLVNFEVGSLVEQELPFFFTGHQFLDKIRPN